jgi:hypothetical protein
MKTASWVAITLIAIVCAVARSDAADAPVSGKAFLRGTPPPEQNLKLDPISAKMWEGKNFPTTRYYLVGTDGGLRDVFVYVKSGLEGRTFPTPSEPVVMRQQGMIYLDYIVGAQTGQKIIVRNLDPILHNVHIVPTNKRNTERNLAQLANKPNPSAPPEVSFTLEHPDLGARLKCDLHHWMFGYVFCVDHPFFAVTDAKGEFHFPQPLPPGDYVIEAIHRKAGAQEKRVTVTADGKLPPLAFEFSPR